MGHGDLRKAIKAGGCGQTFKWTSLEKIQDTITNFEGQRIRCDPPVKYRLEILAKRKEWGIVLSEEESKLAEIKISDLGSIFIFLYELIVILVQYMYFYIPARHVHGLAPSKKDEQRNFMQNGSTIDLEISVLDQF